ncbi:hypothetical protein MTR67_048365 [Solanum verrucosum]|uniref:Uncharacterized protein n=1 Tax=Solanum verrucosum TaxID=315347 RepID=A0AAF0ZZI3_SOLVR|nr:hypothetical protein MTR67_048365 [Solanum verrucosum]
MFVLLGCSTTSTVFDPKQYLCDSGSGSNNCEDSGGSFGFSGADESFACICRNGVLERINFYEREISESWRKQHIVSPAIA